MWKRRFWPFVLYLWVMTYIKLKWHAWQLHNLNHSTCYLLPLSGSFWEPLVWIGLDRDIIVVRRTVSARSAIWRFDGVAIFILPKSAIFPLERPRYLLEKGIMIYIVKVEKIYEDSLDSIPSPSPSVKIQIIGGKVYLR